MTTAFDATAWLAARTTGLRDWPAERLAAAKGDQRVAVVLPARNEAATVGAIVEAIVANFRNGHSPLVDEIVVVDSGSEDGTALVAARAGARVVAAPRAGKGEAMWQGLAATDSDLVAFIDADLERFDPRYVPALVGPLLADPTVEFVKATYDRANDGVTGGGRVTELMARPLLSAFWPELSGVLQPLSGEYAGRRALLERLPFRCGYGVDIGLLLDAFNEIGLDGIAQVDLEQRHHRHSDLASLGRMASEILHTVIDRLIADGRVPCDIDPARLLLQPTRRDTGLGIDPHQIDVSERPPLVMVSTLDSVRA